jgi:N-sulfoglucosamine sulfohydrolase
MENAGKAGFKRFHERAFAKRPGNELYDLSKDPHQLVNVAGKPEYADALNRLSGQLQKHLVKTKDPRALGLDAPWDYYPYYGSRRNKKWTVDPRP